MNDTIFLGTFQVTEMLHEVGCGDCLVAAQDAAIMARATGSVGSTQRITTRDLQGNETLLHLGRVARIATRNNHIN